MKILRIFLGLLACIGLCLVAMAQTYHEDDKEGLRRFLRQPSSIAGQINAQQLGLTIGDTSNWQSSENWVNNVVGLTWNTEIPKRLTSLGASYGWAYKDLAGILNANKWEKLTSLNCPHNQLTALDLSANIALERLYCESNQLIALDVSANTALQSFSCDNNQLIALDVSANIALENLGCYNNQLTALDVSANTALTDLFCSSNQLTELDLSANIALERLGCESNHFLLSDLFAFSEILKNNVGSYFVPGTQTLPAQTLLLGVELNFSVPQNLFNGIYTAFTVTKNGAPAPSNDYVVTNGKITFHKTGNYTVTMTNDAITSSYPNPDYPAEVVFDISVECNISGTIQRQDHTPVSSGVVKLYLVQENVPYILSDTTSVKSDGSYIFKNVANGDYVVKVFPDISENSLPYYYGNAEFCYEASVVSVANSISVHGVNITIPPPFPLLETGTSLIYGYVGEEESGKGVDRPIPDEGVSLRMLQDNSWVTVALIFTNEEGYFEFRDVHMGIYRVVIDIPCLEINSNSSDIVITEHDTVYLELIVPIFPTVISSFTKEDTKIRVYPNPTTGELTIVHGAIVNDNYFIFNTMGQIVRQGRLSCRNGDISISTINVAQLKNGIYFLKISEKIVKFVKQ